MVIACTLLILIGLTFVAECYLVTPRLAFKYRNVFALAIHSLAAILVFIAIFIIFRRVAFSASLCIGLHFLLVVINNAKYQALKENLVFSDIALFSQAFKFPRLYFPFVSSWILVIFPVATLVVLTIGLTLESAVYFSTAVNDAVICVCIDSGLLLVICHLAKKQTLSLEPSTDLQLMGLFASVIIGMVQARQKRVIQAFNRQLMQTPFSRLPDVIAEQTLGDIIVVQSESFFDIRRLYAAISPSILKNYDAIKLASQYAGRLNVPAWGANTLRTEFAFLSGLHDETLGLFRYYPYHYIHAEVKSIAAYLKRQGYRTVCIHPYSADFFERQRVFSLLGFDEFIDISDFSSTDRTGAYISDLAVAEKIVQIQESSDRPVFIFAITIENHGPLHLETITAQDELAVYQTKPDFDSDDMTAYLRHLKNADAMIAYLITHFRQKTSRSCLCFYGDHVPSIPAAYQALNFANSQSDYFIWQSDNENSSNHSQTVNVSDLGLLLLGNMLFKTTK